MITALPLLSPKAKPRGIAPASLPQAYTLGRKGATEILLGEMRFTPILSFWTIEGRDVA